MPGGHTQRPSVEMRDTIPTRPPRPPQTFAPDEYIDMPAVSPQEDFQTKKPPSTIELPTISEEPMPPTQEIELPNIVEEPPKDPPIQEQDYSNDEDYYGLCMNCGKPVFETGKRMNIGGVKDGKPICNECHQATKNMIK